MKKRRKFIAASIVLCAVIFGWTMWWEMTPHWKEPTTRPADNSLVGDYDFVRAPFRINVASDSQLHLTILPDGSHVITVEKFTCFADWTGRPLISKEPPPRVISKGQGEWEISNNPLGGWQIGVLVHEKFESSSFFMKIAFQDGKMLLAGPVGDPDNNEFVVYKQHKP